MTIIPFRGHQMHPIHDLSVVFLLVVSECVSPSHVLFFSECLMVLIGSV